MADSFGVRLRRRREEQNIALSTIVERTKISPSLLEALERDDFSHWPSGIFRRSFIRAYAGAIGLNPDDAARDFFAAHPDMIERPIQETLPEPAPSRFRTLVGAAMGSLPRRARSTAAPTTESRPAPAVPPPTSPTVTAASSTTSTTPNPDFEAVAQLCTQMARTQSQNDVEPLLNEAARILDAIGLIVWIWNATAGELRPALASGYSAKILSHVPTVKRDAANVTAAAFRSAQPCAISGTDHARGALAVPLLTPDGCSGVLAVELRHGAEQTSAIRAVATIFAAGLSPVVGGLFARA